MLVIIVFVLIPPVVAPLYSTVTVPCVYPALASKEIWLTNVANASFVAYADGLSINN
ncbi:hypothetical protein D3C85_1916300 [compost metagenome]